MAKLSRLAGGTSPEGAERVSRPQEHNTGRIYGQNESGKGENHSCAWEIPAGHLPYKAEEFCLRTDKLFAATGVV